jgi:sugar (pentulose or hexulose) kinase
VVLDRRSSVAQDVEVSARGAALLAARAVDAPEDTLRIETQPVAPDAADIETYRRSYERWRLIGEALDEAMRGLP